jgi:hypothetical protein
MKRTFIFLLALIISLTANSQDKKSFLNNFPFLQNADTIITNRQLMQFYYSRESEKNILDTTVAPTLFF